MYAECLEKPHEKSWFEDRTARNAKSSPDTWRNPARPDLWHQVVRKHRVERTAVQTPTCTAPTAEQKFASLVAQWKLDTAFVSSDSDVVMHPAYQDIIGMGKRAIPLILRELQKSGGNWFWALRHISGENPIDPRDIGKSRKMAEAWIRWGQDRHYL